MGQCSAVADHLGDGGAPGLPPMISTVLSYSHTFIRTRLARSSSSRTPPFPPHPRATPIPSAIPCSSTEFLTKVQSESQFICSRCPSPPHASSSGWMAQELGWGLAKGATRAEVRITPTLSGEGGSSGHCSPLVRKFSNTCTVQGTCAWTLGPREQDWSLLFVVYIGPKNAFLIEKSFSLVVLPTV